MAQELQKPIRAALAGNPNCGKSTIFNNLTGARQHVGNYPGVTVEKFQGKRSWRGREIDLVDLPGAYSLTAISEEERVAQEYLVNEKPDVVINIVDASNLERNLYLTLLLKEMRVPLLVVLNMMDLAKSAGIVINKEILSKELGVPVIEAVGSMNQGMGQILEWSEKIADNPTAYWEPRPELEILETEPIAAATARYSALSRICIRAVCSQILLETTVSDRIDRVMTHRIWGIPIFLGLMYLVFQLTFTLGAYPMGWIDSAFAFLSEGINQFWGAESDSLIKSLLVDGIIGGVGGVIVFLPNILLLFLAISLLEDSGYMARAAYMTDRFMHRIGLHGKSFIPLLIGFGCSVPAIMATRTLPTRKDRLITMFIVPLVSCGARLPIYALLIPAFFPLAWQAPILWLLYCLGIALAMITAKALSLFVIKDEELPFIIELPPYHWPTFRTVGIHALERGWLYLKKAGTVILGISIVLWGLTTFPGLDASAAKRFERQRVAVEENTNLNDQQKAEKQTEIDNDEAQTQLANSYVGRFGRFIEPVLLPMGFDWKIGTALIGATAAKEVFVAQMGIVSRVGSVGDETKSLQEIMARNYSPLVGFGIMVFCLISAPCMATFAVMARESGSWKWAAAQWVFQTAVAWTIVTAIYQIGSLWL